MDLLILLGLFILNGLFAMSEIALLSARKIRLQQALDEGVPSAKTALELANSPSHFLSTVQVGITLIGIMSGAYGQAALAESLRQRLDTYPLLATYSEGIALAAVVVGITYFSLVIGELVPKRLALLKPEKIALTMARPMRALSVVAFPLVKLLSWSTDLFLWVLRAKKSEEPLITEKEIRLMIDQGTEAGVFHKGEKAMVSNVMRLDALKVGAIMTPRMDIYSLDIASAKEETRKRLIETPHSVIPVCRNGLDNVIGVITAKDLMRRALAGEDLKLNSALRPATYIPKSLSPVHLLEEFRRSKISLAMVVDEYGEVAGLVTLKDVMEAIVGEIPSDEAEDEGPEAVQRSDGSWLLDGTLSIEKFRQIFGLEDAPVNTDGDFHTLGGFVMQQLGDVPKAADQFVWSHLRFEVVDMDRNRVDKILVCEDVDPVDKSA